MPAGSRELLRFGWTLMMTLRYLRTGGGRALTCFNFSQSHWLLPTSAHHHHLLLLFLALHTSECSAFPCTQYSCLYKYAVQEQEYEAVWAVHGVLSEVTTGDIEVDGSHSIALDWTLARWQPWTIPFPLLLLPLSTAAEILSQTMGNIISNVSDS